MTATATAEQGLSLLDALLTDWVAAAPMLGFGDPDPWQRDVLAALCSGEPYVAVAGCNGCGKTWLSAVAVSCGLLANPGGRVIVTGPKAEHVLDSGWAEIGKAVADEESPLAALVEQHSRRMFVRGAEKTWYAAVRVALRPGKRSGESVAVGLQGHHAPYVLFVVEESSAVPDSVLGAAIGALSTGRGQILAIGNPTRASGWFADAVSGRDSRWKRWNVSYTDAPRVNGAWAEEMIQRYGLEHSWVRSKVLGVPPLTDETVLVELGDVEAAMDREPQESGLRVMGLDPARYGGSKAEAAIAVGSSVVGLHNLGARSADGLAEAALEYAEAQAVDVVVIDCDGYGAAIADVMRQLLRRRDGGPAILEWRGSGIAPNEPRQYYNARTELHVEVARAVRDATVSLPRDDELSRQAVTMHVEVREGDGRLIVESKDQITARLGRSPDEWDATLLALVPAILRVSPVLRGKALVRGAPMQPSVVV